MYVESRDASVIIIYCSSSAKREKTVAHFTHDSSNASRECSLVDIIIPEPEVIFSKATYYCVYLGNKNSSQFIEYFVNV